MTRSAEGADELRELLPAALESAVREIREVMTNNVARDQTCLRRLLELVLRHHLGGASSLPLAGAPQP